MFKIQIVLVINTYFPSSLNVHLQYYSKAGSNRYVFKLSQIYSMYFTHILCMLQKQHTWK